MCGICGIAYADPERRAGQETLDEMRKLVAHRGPDGAGQEIWPGFALGHQRLSVIDPKGGSQPLSNEDHSVWISYNGEIYNFRELRRTLEAAGHRFRTRSDTEVIVHAYEEYGLDFPKRLNGMFALAIYDDRRRRMVLARDHLGIKPLFYTITDEGLFFASTIKAVLHAAGIRPEIRPESLPEYLMFRYVSGRNTFYRNVRSLSPAHTGVWRDGELRTQRYWSPPESAGRDLDLGDAVRELDGVLGGAVERQLVADVPVGSFCSGGIDSGLVTGYAARASTSLTTSYSVGFDDPRWDETARARKTAERFGTDHRVQVARPADIAELLPYLIWYHDEPLSHPNSVPLFLLSKFAGQGVKVVLTGEGADELFCGYPRYHLARLRAGLATVPQPVLSTMSRGVGLLPGHRSTKLAASLEQSPEDAFLFNSSFVDRGLVRRLTGGSVESALTERRALLARSHGGDGLMASLSRYELKTYLRCALDRMDRMSMAVGLESRVPMLDLELLEWGCRISAGLKIRGRRNKLVLSELARSELPRDVTEGPKSGFGMPLHDWFRLPEIRDDLLGRLRDPRHPAAEHLDQKLVDSMLRQHLSGDADHRECLWLLANVYVWAEQNIGGDAPSPPSPLKRMGTRESVQT